MLRSLFSGISGLRQHQTMMDVTGNNIANVNTAGYKASQTVFEDTLSQLLRGAGAPQEPDAGGTNPAQVGLGVRLAQITTNFGQGSAQTTGRSTDLMIQGDGFFAVKQGGETLYTRSGAFNFDANGWLVTSSGAFVQGWTAANGVVNTNATVGNLRLPVGAQLAPTQTSTATVTGNLPAGAVAASAGPPAVPATVITSGIDMFDAQGNRHSMTYELTKQTGAGAWQLRVLEGATVHHTSTVTFNASGQLTSPATVAVAAASPPWSTAATVQLNLAGLTMYGGSNTFAATQQNGSAMGTLQAFTLSPDGTIVGVFSNGLKQALGQIAMAAFNNPPGLEKIGGSMYRNTVNSGNPQLGTAGAGGRGLLSGGNLEMSNVDLAAEFTNLIVAQRGFQANSRVITSSDEILQDLVNLKR